MSNKTMRSKIEATSAFINRQALNSYDLAKVIGCEPASLGPTLTALVERGTLVRRGRSMRKGKRYQVYYRVDSASMLTRAFRTVTNREIGINQATAESYLR